MQRRLFLAALVWGVGQRAMASLPGPLLFVTGDWPPFAGETLLDRGFFTRYVELLARDMGEIAKIEFVPWPRAEAMLRRGEAFAAFPYRQTAARLAEFDFSAPVTKTYTKLFLRKTLLSQFKPPKRLEDLAPYTIGVTRGSGSQEELAKAGIRIESAPSDQHLVRMLLAGRFDMAAVNEHVGWYLLRQMESDVEARFATASLPLTSHDTMLMVSRTYRGQKELLERMNRSIARLHQSRVYENLEAQFLVGNAS